MALRQSVSALLAILLVGSAPSLGPSFAGSPGAAERNDQPIPCDDIDSVGSAKMSSDGAITLQLRSLWPNPIAETELVYAPDDPQYDEIKHHLGGITPGESKPIPPFCGLNSEP